MAKNDRIQTVGKAATKTWRKPDIGWLKCNVDAVVFFQQDIIEYGCVIRDEQGYLIAAKKWIDCWFFQSIFG